MSGKNRAVHFLLIILALPALFGLGGCELVKNIENLNGNLAEQRSDPEVGALLQAEIAFLSGDYALARDLYNDIITTTPKDLHRNHARYGLAAVAIATAENTSEWERGIRMLEGWEKPGPDHDGFTENPRLLAIALNSRLDLLNCKPEIRYVATKEEGELARKYQEEIALLKETIKKLEHQISELETIDQEIQEKRKPI